MKVTILGTGSASPSLIRHPSAQILANDHEKYLIDCGEGTQFQLIKYNIRVSKIKNVLISHLHGDHYFGLIGLISSLNLSHRKEGLTIFGPKGLDEIITIQLKYSNTFLHFPLNFAEIDPNESLQIIDNEHLSIFTIPLKHRIPCCGFLFVEKPKKRNIIKGKLPLGITIDEIRFLKEGKHVYYENATIKYNYNELTELPSKAASYAYCSDTAYLEDIVTTIKDVELLYHEATFRNEHLERAINTFHSTSQNAANIAKLANCKKLLIGHFSSRYDDLTENIKEAKAFFENTEIAEEGKEYFI